MGDQDRGRERGEDAGTGEREEKQGGGDEARGSQGEEGCPEPPARGEMSSERRRGPVEIGGSELGKLEGRRGGGRAGEGDKAGGSVTLAAPGARP